MPLTEKQQQHWTKISKEITGKIISKCFRLVKTHHQDNFYELLVQEISLALNGTPVQQSILLITFNIFTNHLAAQKLNTKQFDKAIFYFNTLPIVEKQLHELPAKIILQLQQQEKIPRLNPGVTTELSAVVPIDTTSEMDPMASFSDEIDLGSLKASVHQWIEDRFSPVDIREEPNNERRQRRMDSLSRLLLLPKGISACIAVTLDVSTKPRLVISANVGKNGTQPMIIAEIESKLRIIQKYLTQINKSSPLYSPDELESLARQLMEQLLPTIATPLEIPLQAAKKIIDAVCFDEDTFDEKDKSAFLNDAPAVIIVHKITEIGAKMQVRHLYARECSESEIDLPKVKKHTAIKDIHAEQLLAYFLFVERKIQSLIKSPLIFGISKLCCQTCFANLQRYNESNDKTILTFRGHHGKIYKGVVDITTAEAAKTESTRSAPTEAKPSPGDTPDKRRRAKQDDGNAPSKHFAARRLIMTDDPSNAEEESPSMVNSTADSFDCNLEATQRYRFMSLSRNTTVAQEEVSIDSLSLMCSL